MARITDHVKRRWAVDLIKYTYKFFHLFPKLHDFNLWQPGKLAVFIPFTESVPV